MRTLSIVIPCGGNASWRLRNLEEVLICLRSQTRKDFELILVEQSTDGQYYHDQKSCDLYLPIEDPMNRPFNRSWCRNVGAYHASGELLLLMDGDYVFQCDYLEKVIKMEDYFFSGTNLFYWSDARLRETYLEKKDFSIFRQSPSFPPVCSQCSVWWNSWI
jgi:glycosyltransferase involved in cell wall biosynthesis